MSDRPTRAQRQAALVQAQAPKAPTATEQLAALKEREAAGGGYLIPPPAHITRLSVLAWLQATAEIGSPGHVELAWYFIDNTSIKRELQNQYEQLAAEAGRRHYALEERAAAEQAAERAAHGKRARIADLKREAETLKKRLVAIELEIEAFGG